MLPVFFCLGAYLQIPELTHFDHRIIDGFEGFIC